MKGKLKAWKQRNSFKLMNKRGSSASGLSAKHFIFIRPYKTTAATGRPDRAAPKTRRDVACGWTRETAVAAVRGRNIKFLIPASKGEEEETATAGAANVDGGGGKGPKRSQIFTTAAAFSLLLSSLPLSLSFLLPSNLGILDLRSLKH